MLEELARRARAGRLPTFLYITEEIGEDLPRYGMVGRFRVDPLKAIGHLAVMKEKVKDFAASQGADLEPE